MRSIADADGDVDEEEQSFIDLVVEVWEVERTTTKRTTTRTTKRSSRYLLVCTVTPSQPSAASSPIVASRVTYSALT